MPFKSEQQKKFLFSQKPDVAKKFVEHSNKKRKYSKEVLKKRIKSS